MERGYVRLYRKALDCGFIQDARVWQVLSWCLLKATHRRFRTFFNGRLVELLPGQLVTSREAACRELSLSVQEYRTALGKLLLAGALACEATSWGTVITVVNWHVYQYGISEGQPGGQPGGNRETTRPSTIIQEQKHTGYPGEAGAHDARTRPAHDPASLAASGENNGPGNGGEAGRTGGNGGRDDRAVRRGAAARARGDRSARGDRRVRGAVDEVSGGWGARVGAGRAGEFEEAELPPWAREAGA